MKPITKARRAFLLALLVGTTVASTGCSSGGYSLASVNPFARKTPTLEPTAGNNVTDSIASAGTATKSAFSKTTGAIAGVFRRAPEEPLQQDPLSLSQKPEKIAPEVFYANGQLWESTGDMKKAMESYTKALESDPQNVPSLSSIARLHFVQGNYPDAVKHFQQAIKISPQDAVLHNDLGLTLSKMGKHPEAIQSLTTALTLAPGTSRYANNLATVRFESGDKQSAYQVLSKNNKPAVAHFNMAYLHYKNGQMTEAKGHLSEAVRYEPQADGDMMVQRAVERSRDMLAQIDGSMAPVAQAAPHATIAGGQFFNAANKATIQQTSQTTQPSAKPYVAPSAPVTQPTAKVTAPQASTPPVPPNPAVASAESAAKEAPTAKAEPAAKTDGPQSIPGFSLPVGTESAPKADRPMPIRPTEAKASEPSSNGFAMPE